MEFMKKIRVNMTVNALLTIIIGILFIINPGGTGTVIAKVAGAAILIAGIADIIRYATAGGYEFLSGSSLFGGIVKCVLGVFALTHTVAVLELLSYILSIFIIISGISCMESSMQLKRAQVAGWAVNAVLSAVILAAGVFMLFCPFEAVATAILIAGIILVADGLTELFTAYRMRKIGKEFKKKMKDIMDEIDGNIIDM